ncbi:DNA cytosine methyltransferase [uncultured Croceicoccus sp.]|uniref:DNA cytosine methyltransferase n=1 Tax=uncultured Croceicoccus sp. TaxID=1295329 RepID=UPI00262C898B|nr:DNA cytosine methyltransferase [uncultured Croceicoccus sp.]
MERVSSSTSTYDLSEDATAYDELSHLPVAAVRNHVPLAIDVFSGAGGFSLGAIQAGFEVRAAVENFGHAAATYRKQIRNFTGRKVEFFEEDILNLSPHKVMDEGGLAPGDCDLFLGGPPCQGFSSHRLGKSGVNDPRNALLYRYFHFLDAVRPRMFLLENVPGLLQPKHAEYLSTFLGLAEDNGYAVREPIILNAKDFGVPQNRKRVFIVGYDPKAVEFAIPWPPHPTHGEPGKLSERGPLMEWRTSAEVFAVPAPPNDPNDHHMQHRAELIEVFRSTPPNGGSRSQSLRTLPCHMQHNGHKDVYGRIDPSKPSPTMTTACINPSKGRFVHPTEHHGITARQAARLQTFPDDFQFEGGLMASGIQIGNAVPVALAKHVVSQLRNVLTSSTG